MFLQVAKTPTELNGTRVDAEFLRKCSHFECFEKAVSGVKSSELSEYWRLILISIAVSRRNNGWLGKLAGTQASGECKKQLIDCLFVTFMFNMINEVANSYSIRPEWSGILWSGTIRRRLLEFSLPKFVRLENVTRENEDPEKCDLPGSIVQLGGLIRGSKADFDWPVSQPSFVWKWFEEVPRMAIAIQQIFFALALINRDSIHSRSVELFQHRFTLAVSRSVSKLNNPQLCELIESCRAHPDSTNCETQAELYGQA